MVVSEVTVGVPQLIGHACWFVFSFSLVFCVLLLLCWLIVGSGPRLSVDSWGSCRKEGFIFLCVCFESWGL